MKDRTIIFVLLILELLLCFTVISLFPIALDEPFSIFQSQKTLPELFSIFVESNNAPLHFVLLHFWIKLFGISAIAVRSLSVIISLVSIFVLYQFSRKFWRKEFTVVLVLLFMLSRVNHFVALEARMYGLFTLFFILIIKDMYALLIENKKVMMQLAIWNALLLYTHYIGGVVLVLEALVFFLFFKELNKSKWIQGIGTFILTIILFLPGIQLFIYRTSNFASTGTWVQSTTFKDLWVNLVQLMNNEFTLFATISLTIFTALYWKRKGKGKGNGTSNSIIHYFLLWSLGGYFICFVISLTIQPIFIVKYLQFLTIPLFGVFIAIVANQTPKEEGRSWVNFVLIIPFLLSFKPIPEINRETDKLVDFVKELNDPFSYVYYCPPHYELTLAYHLNRDLFKDYKFTLDRLKEEKYFSVYHGRDIHIEDPMVKNIIYIDFEADFLYPQNEILYQLNANYNFDTSATFKGNFNVYRFKI